jgi:transcriptional antiterminator RfaH
MMSCEYAGTVPHWYAVYTHNRQEERAHNNLQAWRVETFAPRIKERRYNFITGLPTFVVKLMFPRYIFARFEAEQLLHKVSFTRGVKQVVNFGGAPTPVADEVIDLLKAQTGPDGYVCIDEELKSGDTVIIKDGPLKDFMAVFERRTSGTDRVRLLLLTINYQGHVELNRELVRKVG